MIMGLVIEERARMIKGLKEDIIFIRRVEARELEKRGSNLVYFNYLLRCISSFKFNVFYP
ncbi:hypothetical protein COX97_01570 [Candidatus Pacearchaeota archaeon CG_4_10_14_0_2_um_filter_05_32_18]|nr:MAG: hypothetical protein AUJ62_03570 [Candidatus Pacearchaeota archaeon CG1_02_32_21]PIZ83152.1 MAG: hypothetical protein COX97_01570 [Candidatus Pacearchaeota archaeon CG_4_10_14_0_2_um_filter_05_32_18]